MLKIGFVITALMIAGVAQAQDAVCTNQAITQTRAKIHEHYAKQGIDASLPWISTVDLSGITSNGPAHEGPEYESVEYTSYIIVGTLVLKGKGQFMDYAFYVRLNNRTCDVLKVALLRTGKSPYLAVTSATTPKQVNDGGPSVSAITVAEIETPKDGSPKIGYTYAGVNEESVPVIVHATYLDFLKERAEQLIRKY